MDIESSGINCFGKLFTFIIVLSCLFRVEDAEGCFILTDRYADNREAAVSVFRSCTSERNVSYLFSNQFIL